MTHEGKVHDDAVAAGAICTLPNCRALVIVFRETRVARADLWEFECWRCGAQFAVPNDRLLLQPVPKDWLLAGVHLA
jgi:hypothetical protein